jgi:hypothetical protein
MKKILIACLLTSSIFAEYIDLGTEGHLYKIKEQDIMIDIKGGVNELQKKFTKEYVSNKIKEEINRQAVGHTDLPFCKKDNNTVEPNYYIIKEDIYNPAGRLIKQKGESVIVNNQIPLDICFIDASNEKEAENQINFYRKTVKQLSGKNATCTFMVAKKNILDLDKKFWPTEFYPTGKGYEQNFGVSCYPTLIHIDKDKRFKFELSMERFKQKKER